MVGKITSHAAIEEIIESFLDHNQQLWVKPERSPAVDLVPFIVKSLREGHKTLCLQHIHDTLSTPECAYCGYTIMNNANIGPIEFGVEI